MRKPMTKKECYQICAQMWRWIAKTGAAHSSAKWDWPGMKGHSSKYAYGCAACEWIQQHAAECSHCPLLKLWTSDGDWTITPCISSITSPYRSFHMDQGTKEDAMRIVKFCEKKLREIKKGQSREEKR